MKVELIVEHSFTLRTGEHAIHGLCQAGTWESFSRYKAANGDIVITEGDKLLRASPGIAGLLNCGPAPAGFVLVPQVVLPGGMVVPPFYVAQFAASQAEDGQAVIDGARKPWANIDFNHAWQACHDAGYDMISERQWLAIAWDACCQAVNWTGGAVGCGDLFQGVRYGRHALAGDEAPARDDERRWLTLSNGSCVCDFNGNLFQWVVDNVQGDSDGLIARHVTMDSPSMASAPFPSAKRGVGWRPNSARDWSGSALIRGGCWGSGSVAGAFLLSCDWPFDANGYIGFRCTKSESALWPLTG